jgi:hypothetical protein
MRAGAAIARIVRPSPRQLERHILMQSTEAPPFYALDPLEPARIVLVPTGQPGPSHPSCLVLAKHRARRKSAQCH